MRTDILTLVITTSLCWATTAFADSAWRLLGSVEIEEIVEDDLYLVQKTFPPGLPAQSDAFEIAGFVVPVTAEPYLSTFILVEDPDNCPFCGTDSYGPALEVHLKRPIDSLPEFTPITLRGRLELVEDPETFQAFRLIEAIPTR